MSRSVPLHWARIRALPHGSRPAGLALAGFVLVGFALVAFALLAPGWALGAELAMGDTISFRAYDWSYPQQQPIQLLAKVEYVGTRAVICVEKNRPVPEAFVQGVGQAFDSQVYPRLTAVLGSEPDPGVDGDGRLVILMYDFEDARVIGSFVPADMDPALAGDPDSNHMEMFALNLEAVLPDVDMAAAASAHEFAHLIMYYRDYLLDPSPARWYEGFERSDGGPSGRWVEEAIAMYAELVAGYGDRAEDSLRSFTYNSNNNLTSWAGAGADEYGASYAFGAYLAERMGESFITALVSQPLDGVAGIDAVLAEQGAFDDFGHLFDDWVLANLLEGRPPPLPPWSHSSLDFLMELQTDGSPWPQVGTDAVANYGAFYLDLPATETSSTVRVVVDGADGAPLHAALVSWDSTGHVQPNVEHIALAPESVGGTATSPPGYDRHTLAVWARGAEGSDASYPLRYSLAVDPVTDIQFLDVGGGYYLFSYIDELLTRGAISGWEKPPGSGLWFFRPDNQVLRAQFAKMVVESAGLHTPAVEGLGNPSFSDVPPAYDGGGEPLEYPFDYVEEAAAAGIVQGYADGRFGPWDPIKRVQLVRMIVRAAEATGHPLEPYEGSELAFADVRPGDWDYDYVMTAYANGIVDGKLNGLFDPWATATRAQVAKMTANLTTKLEAAEGSGS